MGGVLKMSKSEELTRQWKDGILPEGHYYIRCKCEESGEDSEEIIDRYERFIDEDAGFYTPDSEILEVLSKVPTYKEDEERSYTELELRSELETLIGILYKNTNYHRWLQANFPKELAKLQL